MWYRHSLSNDKKIECKFEILQMPFQMFNILDLAGINAFLILYRETTREKISRQEFLFQLAVKLAAMYISRIARRRNYTKITNKYKFRFTRTKSSCQVKYCKG